MFSGERLLVDKTLIMEGGLVKPSNDNSVHFQQVLVVRAQRYLLFLFHIQGFSTKCVASAESSHLYVSGYTAHAPTVTYRNHFQEDFLRTNKLYNQ